VKKNKFKSTVTFPEDDASIFLVIVSAFVLLVKRIGSVHLLLSLVFDYVLLETAAFFGFAIWFNCLSDHLNGPLFYESPILRL
jgi:hypothetical protein